MNYSRRQLEAFGEPLGESITRKEGGRIIYGGGGSSAPTTQTQTQISDLPDWAKPSAQKILAKGEALTDINANPYQQYQGERLAGFSPLQQQAFQGAEQFGPSSQLGGATQLTGAASLRALGAGYNPYQTGQFADQAAQYMSPYAQNVIDREKMEAARVSEMQRNVDQARAVGQGAFGGSRQAIVEAERQRGLRSQLGDIQTKGLQSAYDRAQQQFNTEQQLREQSRQYGAGFGMQGLQTALQGAGQLGTLGQQQFGQAKETLGLQQQFGAQQQQQEQQRLTQQYQDFMNQQRYPYQQLEFMSNILRGTPMGTVQTLYGAQPTMAQNLGALGLGAYGLSKVFAEGGSVTSDANVENILAELSTEQLKKSRQIALANRDMERVQMIDDELAERASSDQGLGSAFNQLPGAAQENIFQAASGGIVAFADGGYNPPQFAPLYQEASRLSSELPNAMYTAPTQEETIAGIRAQRGLVQEMMGTDKLTPFMEELAAQRQQLKSGSERDRGFAALAAVKDMLEGRGVAAIGRGVSKFGSELARTEKENREADRMLLASQTQLASAQQARADGQFDKANALFKSGEELRIKALDAKRDVLGKQANLQATMGGQALTAQGQKFQTETQAQTSRYVADTQAKTQRDLANKPGETERIMERISRITNGDESFAGKTGEEGVKLYKQSLGDVGAARYGITEPGGQRPGTAPNAAALENAISQAVRADPRTKPAADALALAQLRADSYTRKNKPVPPEVERRLVDAQTKANEIREEHAARIRGAGAPAAGASAAGRGTGARALPLPASEAELVGGNIYQTARGPAKWDASSKQFIPVQ